MAKNPERMLQEACVSYMRFAAWKPDVFWSAIMHEHDGRQSPAFRAVRARMGLQKGLPDLIILSDKVHFVELKSAKGRLSDEQKAFQEHCEKNGIHHAVIREVDDFANKLKAWNLTY